ncbi:MAG TPA: DUF3576 domain-containing protein [Stellaceae bacterium]|nr:DUF3576 domain-containing protein [Stellaceae bacterium]
MQNKRSFFFTIAALVVVLAGCGDIRPDTSTASRENAHSDLNSANGNILGEGGMLSGLFNGSDKKDPNGGGIGVNSYLWRASLDTVSFMPLASADPFGGVIITDWYSPPETPKERFKINIYILDRQLRADGVRATVFRQQQAPDGRWVDAPTEANTGSNFENTILTRARQIRMETAAKQ